MKSLTNNKGYGFSTMVATLEQVIEDIQGIEGQLRLFERKYLIPSHVFYEMYLSGHIEHEPDFGEWAAYIQLRKQREEQYKALLDKMGGLIPTLVE
jgi:hypothetical protein